MMKAFHMGTVFCNSVHVRTSAGISRGNGAGKASTMPTLAEFTDRPLFGEDIFCSGDEDNGFLSSHRIMSSATHQCGAFGAASGRKPTFRTIADTFCHENRVWDDWLIRDNSAIAIQLGNTAEVAARTAIMAGDCQMPFAPETDIAGP
jgi:hypothetical protein